MKQTFKIRQFVKETSRILHRIIQFGVFLRQQNPSLTTFVCRRTFKIACSRAINENCGRCVFITEIILVLFFRFFFLEKIEKCLKQVYKLLKKIEWVFEIPPYMTRCYCLWIKFPFLRN